jgi:hypothetical protein
MPTTLSTAKVRTAWEDLASSQGSAGWPDRLAGFAYHEVPTLLHRLEVLEAALARVAGCELLHPAAYAQTILDEITGP